jgi:hypothetical protein
MLPSYRTPGIVFSDCWKEKSSQRPDYVCKKTERTGGELCSRLMNLSDRGLTHFVRFFTPESPMFAVIGPNAGFHGDFVWAVYLQNSERTEALAGRRILSATPGWVRLRRAHLFDRLRAHNGLGTSCRPNDLTWRNSSDLTRFQWYSQRHSS